MAYLLDIPPVTQQNSIFVLFMQLVNFQNQIFFIHYVQDAQKTLPDLKP